MAMSLGEATVAEGASGTEVKEIQQILTGQGYAVGPIDGLFGPATKTAVQAFQRTKGLVPDGIIGPLTWDALRGKVAPSLVSPAALPGPVVAPVPKMGFGMTTVLYGLGALAAVVMLFGRKRGT